jgi:hypothetical protein
MTSGIESNAGCAGVCAECPLTPFLTPFRPLLTPLDAPLTAVMPFVLLGIVLASSCVSDVWFMKDGLVRSEG